MHKTKMAGLVAVVFLATACQSNSYKIEGSGDGIADGDTLFIFDNPMNDDMPSDTVIVKDGKFAIEGQTDSTAFCLIYNKRDPNIVMPFFKESGTIRMRLSKDASKSTVAGTDTNDRWQELNDSVTRIGLKIGHIAESIYTGTLTTEEQRSRMAEIEKLNGEFSDCVASYIEHNIDNELGCFLLSYYPDEVVSADRKLRLIAKLPNSRRSRPAIRQLETELKRKASYAVGKQLADIVLPDADGRSVSLLSEIKKNKLTIIDFWASWCSPCRVEMPTMVAIYDKYRSKGLGIVGISLDENKQSWLAAVNKMGMKWKQLSDLKGWQCAAAQMYGVESIPYTIVIASDGIIQKIGLRGSQLEEYIAAKMAE